ncbi:MAG: GntR family transcriptional regulator [Anaerovoracaceae bacterium]
MIDYKKVSLSNQIFEKIEEGILHGQYPQGSIIFPEKTASDLRVGLGTVKEALIRLEAERLIEDTSEGLMVVGITAGDIDHMFNVKRRIEAEATAMATLNMSDDALSELGKVLQNQERAVESGDAEAVKNLDTRFHDIIYAGCGSATYELILSPIHHKLSKYRKASLEKKDRIINAVREHRQVYEAMLRRDSEEVEKLMLTHIEHAYASIKN